MSVLILAFALPVGAWAAEDGAETVSYLYYEDGSCLRITTAEFSTWIIRTKTGSKTYEYVDSSGQLIWKAVLSGTFMYNGNSATCTDSACDVTTYDTTVSVVSKTVGHESNYAYATLVIGKEALGVIEIKNTYELKISCDPEGNLS